LFGSDRAQVTVFSAFRLRKAIGYYFQTFLLNVVIIGHFRM